MHEMLMYTAEMKSQTSQPWQLKAAKVCLLESHVCRVYRPVVICKAPISRPAVHYKCLAWSFYSMLLLF